MKCCCTPRRSAVTCILAATAIAAFATFGNAQDQPIPLPFPPAAPRTGPELPRVMAPSVAKDSGTRTLDLGAIEQLARANNPTLMQADAELEGELGKAVQAGLWYNPNLIYSGEQINVKAEGENGSRHTPGEFQGLLLQQRFVTAGKLRLSREKYLARADAAKQQVRAQSFRVLNDVRIHYYHVLARAALVKIHEELFKNVEDRWVTTREMFNQGQANEVDFRLATESLQRSRLDFAMARNDYRSTVARLSAVTGEDLSDAMISGELEGPIDLIEFDSALKAILAESPEIAEANAKLRSDEYTVRRERVEPIPDIFVTAGAGYNYTTRQSDYSAQVSARIPIFDRNQGTVRQARADLARQRAEVKRIELELKRRLADQYQVYLTGLQHVRDYQAVVLPESRKAYETQLIITGMDVLHGRRFWPCSRTIISVAPNTSGICWRGESPMLRSAACCWWMVLWRRRGLLLRVTSTRCRNPGRGGRFAAHGERNAEPRDYRTSRRTAAAAVFECFQFAILLAWSRWRPDASHRYRWRRLAPPGSGRAAAAHTWRAGRCPCRGNRSRAGRGTAELCV